MNVFVVVKKTCDFEEAEEVNTFKLKSAAINFVVANYSDDPDLADEIRLALNIKNTYIDTDGNDDIIWTIHKTNLE